MHTVEPDMNGRLLPSMTVKGDKCVSLMFLLRMRRLPKIHNAISIHPVGTRKSSSLRKGKKRFDICRQCQIVLGSVHL